MQIVSNGDKLREMLNSVSCVCVCGGGGGGGGEKYQQLVVCWFNPESEWWSPAWLRMQIVEIIKQ